MTAVPTRITAAIIFDPDVTAPRDGVLHVAILDVSRADAAAIPVSSMDVIPSAPDHSAERGLEIAFPDVSLEHGRDYIVRAHWDSRGDDRVEAGDQLTTSSVPVPVGAGSVRVSVPLTRIG